MSQILGGYRVTQIPTHTTCAECRFGAGLPQGPRHLMRCVHPAELTAGQFLRGPLACEGFETREGLPTREIAGQVARSELVAAGAAR
jgi:hypothetical protein